MKREFDIIVWGATGFTGKLVAEYLYNKYSSNGAVRWAMAGRNQTKLEAVRAEVADETVSLVLADSHDEASLNSMASRTKVICSNVGPFLKYGAKLVEACVNNQTHYCDLTGESIFVRQTIDKHHETAKANGTKIVPSCGFDSIPSDLGVYYVQQEAKKQTGQPAKEIRMRVTDFKGEFSGGTFATLMLITQKVRQDKSLFGIVGNPYSLNPVGEQTGIDKPGIRGVVYDEVVKSWIYPFIMEGINTKTVRRSNALSGYAYGKDFQYSEAMYAGDGEAGKQIAQKILERQAATRTKEAAQRMPKPGEGPSKEKREAGHYTYKFFTTLQDGTSATGIVTGDRDPGYGSTSKIIAESAVCLAQDDLPSTAGVITPAIAMGDALLKRLQANAGLTFSYE